ncbi:alpha/beta hydrolase [Nocardia sp. NPDC050406]|uniref:alpha/beta hydrolase n=1 Tax=Nocardia sp. NPDC050406 TaxID=3364318 RepID=UPI0037BB7535
MILRGSFSAAAAVLLALTVSAVETPARAQTALPGSIEIPCATRVLEQSADWYLPAGEPLGLVWIQHGFARANANVSALATLFSEAGYLVFAPSLPFMNFEGCTLQNLGDNSAFLYSVATLFGTADSPGGPLAASLEAAAARAGVAAPAIPRETVFIGHSAGAEAVAFVADRIRTAYPETWSRLRGLVLLDPVRSFLGDNIDRALRGIDPTGLPVLTIAAPPAPCNTFGVGTLAVQALLHRPFIGVRLPQGTHTDAEGASTDLLGGTLCGGPDPASTAMLHTLTLGWTHDFLTGTITPELYPAADRLVVPAAPAANILATT